MKNTLAMSLNIPAVKTLYLAGVNNSIQMAKGLGITGLNQPDRYGLSLVLGGGEVKLIDHVNAYGTLADNGIKHDQTSIMRIEDKDGTILEQYKQTDGQRIVDEKYLSMLDYIMSTNELRAPVFGDNNPFKFTDRPVAAKTGTTDEFRDGWAMGYTPSIVAGVWAGNNNNSPMKAGADGIVVAAPIWRAFMDKVLVNYPVEEFPKYEKEDAGKPVLNGDTGKEDNVKVCKIPGTKNDYCLASDACPDSWVEKKDFSDIHDILYYVNKDDPRGDSPKDPKNDSQFKNWEKGVLDWAKKNGGKKNNGNPAPTEECTKDQFSKIEPDISVSVSGDIASGLSISADIDSPFGVDKVTFSVDGKEIKSMSDEPYKTSYDTSGLTAGDKVIVKAEVKDNNGNSSSDSKSVSL
jgi:membrane peptidoglycan carboxypeptidase